jgi:CelD/BcsL family acetyltransferase involved in cellulose biosynthesis
MVNYSDYVVSSDPVTELADLESEWLDLQERADCSYFQSWGWIGTWLKQIAIDLRPRVIRIRHGGLLVGMGILVPAKIKRHLIIYSYAHYLNEYPFNDRNMVVEFNGLLADRGHETAVYTETINYVFKTDKNCDELFLGAINDRTRCALPVLRSPELLKDMRLKECDKSNAWAVNLDQFGPDIEAYMATLGKNRRAQLRRSFRYYDEHGQLSMHEAGNLMQAMEYFEGLKVLHTRRWQSVGQKGVFANLRWEAFHRALVRSRFPHNEVQLLMVTDANGPLGYLYNFIWRKHVYVLQSGFRTPAEKYLLPGYVVHVLAIVHNRKNSMKTYDLMHGDSLYKRLLCNHEEQLYWMVYQRGRLKFRLEDVAVKMVRSGKNLVKWCRERSWEI